MYFYISRIMNKTDKTESTLLILFAHFNYKHNKNFIFILVNTIYKYILFYYSPFPHIISVLLFEFILKFQSL